MDNQIVAENTHEINVIPTGKLKCYITGKLRKKTPEELVRQDVARSLVEEYGYPRKQLDIEFSIKMGRAKKRADIVIFGSELDDHIQENVYCIVEVKPEKIKPSDKREGLSQLETYVSACINCKYALWVGNERLAFNITNSKTKKELINVPDIPHRGEYEAPKPIKSKLVPAVNLKQVFKRIHNYIYANQGFQKDKAFEELQKLIFVKVYDEQYSPTLQFYVLPDEDGNTVKNRLTKVFNKVKNHYKYIFKGNERIELNSTVLRYIVSELQRFSLVDTKTDIKGEAYEQIVGTNLRGDRGEFFTPRTVCDMTVEMLFSLIPEERITSPGDLKIIDPAVGTGGFLIECVQKVKDIFLKREKDQGNLRDRVKAVANSNFYGIDFNPFLVKVAQMNMVMHGDGSSNIVYSNSLETPSNWSKEAKEKIEFGSFDIVVTNPPFGTKVKIDDPRILSQYSLTTFEIENQRNALPTEQLFIERCLDFLKPGGYVGIVLPDSILSNPGLIWVREWILKKAYVIASIDLPVETFQPHTGTQTSVLILKKKTKEQEKYNEEHDIFMSLPQTVGHDRRGNDLYRTTPDGKVKLNENDQPIIDDNLPIVSKMFKKWVKDKGMVQ